MENDEKQKRALPDVSKFIETIKSHTGFFDGGEAIFVTRAPGRLDVMGGIADYSGSLVLEIPIAEAALVALQKDETPVLTIESFGAEENDRANFFRMPLADFERGEDLISYSEAEEYFKSDSAKSWAAYIAGAFLVLMREKKIRFKHGAKILIDSQVPEGKGVSSSAAIEVAAMKAIAAAFEIEIEDREIAVLCQKVENLIVGAPCGIMDQMSSACAAENRLLAIICQPAEICATIEKPENLAVWGIDSGIRHSVGAGDYGSVRTGAFIGYRIIADIANLKIESAQTNEIVHIEDEKWRGYLANITPAEFEKNFADKLPKEISGAEFLRKYGGITDRATKVLPDKIYQVLHPTAHPIYENHRVNKFAKLLGAADENKFRELGNLMRESHESYSRCGLGSDGTDLLVALVNDCEKLYGAKITGGGSGGTIAVLGKKGADDQIEKVVAEYEKLTNYQPYVFGGSSGGAKDFGFLKIAKK